MEKETGHEDFDDDSSQAITDFTNEQIFNSTGVSLIAKHKKNKPL